MATTEANHRGPAPVGPTQHVHWCSLWVDAVDAAAPSGPTGESPQRQLAVDRLSLLACSLEAHGGIPPAPGATGARRRLGTLEGAAACLRHLRPALAQALHRAAQEAGLPVGEVIDAVWTLGLQDMQAWVAGPCRDDLDTWCLASRTLLGAIGGLPGPLPVPRDFV